jgi:hypothetical protein
MAITFEQAYAMLNTLNIDIKGFNEYLNNVLKENTTIINDSTKITNTSIKKPFVKKSWADYEDEDDFPLVETKSVNSDTTFVSEDNSTSSSICNKNSFATIALKNSDSIENFQSIVKKSSKKNTISTITNPMLKNYGLSECNTVFNGQEMAIAIKEKWELGVEYQIDYNSLCPTMMAGFVCNPYCNYIHLHRCNYEKQTDGCKNSNCRFLHARDMPNSKAKSNFRKTLQ